MDELHSDRPSQPTFKDIPPRDDSSQQNQVPPPTTPGSDIPPAPEGHKPAKECRPDQVPWWKHAMELAAILVGLAVAIIYYG